MCTMTAAFAAATLALLASLNVAAGGNSIHTVARTSLVTTARMPATCYCGKSSKSNKNSVCLDITNKATGACKARTCEASFECMPGKKNGMLCIRRKTTKKVVETSPGYCQEKPISGFQYVPYNAPAPGINVQSGNAPASTRGLPTGGSKPYSNRRGKSKSMPVVEPTKNKKGLFFVVAGNKVVFRTKKLNAAKRVLGKIKKSPRAIFQIKHGKVLSPKKVAGYPQTKRYGFNAKWRNDKQIRRMRNACIKVYRKRYVKPKKKKPIVRRTKNKRGKFIVVVGKKVVGKAKSLNQAKKILKKQRKSPRAIFQVKGRKVLGPSRVAGYPQSPKFGFNRKWSGNKDIYRMRSIARKSLPRQIRTKPKFIVVSRGRVVVYTRFLNKAKHYLKKYAKKGGSRCMFEVRGKTVLKDPHRILGRQQLPKFGFYKNWQNWHDIRRMHSVAVTYIKRRNTKPKKPSVKSTKNRSGKFFVVVGKKVVGKAKFLNQAKKILKKQRKSPRAIFQVKGRKVLLPYRVAGYPQSPKFGFNRKWRNKKDVYGMRSIVVKSSQPKKPKVKPTKNEKGIYIVVGGKKVVSWSRYLNRAKSMLKRVRSKPRAIYQVKNRKVVRSPKKVARYPQTISFGFNKYWRTAKDRFGMYLLAKKYYRTRLVKKRRKPKSKFIVVSRGRVKIFTSSLKRAKSVLSKYAGRGGSRCIFEVRGKTVLKDPHRIAGQKQETRYGFRKYWHNWDDIRKMHKVAVTLIARSRKPKRRRARFVVVAGKKVIGHTMHVTNAMKMLRRYKKGARSPSRCIFSIKSGKVQKNVGIVGGKKQYRGLRSGFNKYWRDGKDIARMRYIAQKYVTKHNLF